MSPTNISHLLLALIILISIVLLLLLLYFLLYTIRSHNTKSNPPPDAALEAGEQDQDQLFRHFAQEHPFPEGSHCYRKQRLSSLPPSIELLPHIKTSEDRTEEWLEKGTTDGGYDVSGGELGLKKVPKTHQVLGVKQEREFMWDWKSGREGGSGAREKPRE